MKGNDHHKRAFLIWLAIYPLLTTVLWIGDEYLMKFPLLLRTLLLTGIIVPAVYYILLPGYSRLFRKWFNEKN